MSCLARDTPGLIVHLKKTGLAKKEMRACRLQTRIPVWTLKKKRHACVREKSMRCERSTVCRFGSKRLADVRSRNAASILARCRWIRLTLSGCPKRVAAALCERFQAKSVSNARPAVDKPLHIHRMRCAERAFLKTGRFFSNIGASPIQSLSRALFEP
jgi:ribosomal protein L39E